MEVRILRIVPSDLLVVYCKSMIWITSLLGSCVLCYTEIHTVLLCVAFLWIYIILDGLMRITYISESIGLCAHIQGCVIGIGIIAWLYRCECSTYPDSKAHGANMRPIWGRQDPGEPHVGPMNFAIWVLRTRINHALPKYNTQHSLQYISLCVV